MLSINAYKYNAQALKRANERLEQEGRKYPIYHASKDLAEYTREYDEWVTKLVAYYVEELKPNSLAVNAPIPPKKEWQAAYDHK